jgi:hypothetical protein
MDDTYLNENARKLFNAIPVDGKLTGKQAKIKTGLSDVHFTNAKQDLKKNGLIVLGKGRGGTMIRVEGAELPPEEEVKTPEEALEIAREVKKEKGRAQKEQDKIKAAVLAAGERKFPEADKLVIGLYQGDYYVEVWKDNKADTEFIPEYEWSEDD